MKKKPFFRCSCCDRPLIADYRKLEIMLWERGEDTEVAICNICYSFLTQAGSLSVGPISRLIKFAIKCRTKEKKK